MIDEQKIQRDNNFYFLFPIVLLTGLLLLFSARIIHLKILP